MIGSIAITLVVQYLLLVEPWLGRRAYRRMQAALDIGTPSKRRRAGSGRDVSPRRAPAIAGNRDLLRMLPRLRDKRFGFAALATFFRASGSLLWPVLLHALLDLRLLLVRLPTNTPTGGIP